MDNISDNIGVQWFPGHMAKTKRLIRENLPLVDAVVEIIDARIPISSANPDLRSIIGQKPKIVVLNKSDYADNNATLNWINYYKDLGSFSFSADCRSGGGLNKFAPTVKLCLADLISKNESKGMGGKSLRLMVVGIPNVGKSSFINRLAGRKKTKVEDRPGVTREKQWIKISENFELLDMPGVLWPKFDDKLVGERLAFTGAVKDNVIDKEGLAARLLLTLVETYPENIIERYKIDVESDANNTDSIEIIDNNYNNGYDLLIKVAQSRGMLLKGGDVDLERAAIAVLDEFRAGKLGRITLELPNII